MPSPPSSRPAWTRLAMPARTVLLCDSLAGAAPELDAELRETMRQPRTASVRLDPASAEFPRELAAWAEDGAVAAVETLRERTLFRIRPGGLSSEKAVLRDYPRPYRLAAQPETPFLRGTYVWPELAALWRERGQEALFAALADFCREAFRRFGQDRDTLRPDALDALPHNAVRTAEGLRFFDLNRSRDGGVPKAWFLLRLLQIDCGEYFARAGLAPVPTRAWHRRLCAAFGLRPRYRTFLWREAVLRTLSAPASLSPLATLLVPLHAALRLASHPPSRGRPPPSAPHENGPRLDVFRIDVEPDAFDVFAVLRGDTGKRAEPVALRGEDVVRFARIGPVPPLAGFDPPPEPGEAFSVRIPFAADRPCEVFLCQPRDGAAPVPIPVSFSGSAPVTHAFPHSFCSCGKALVRPTPCGFSRTPAALARRIAAELRFDLALLQSPVPGERAVVPFRLAYRLLKPFARKRVWLVTDRVLRADDNGFALFRHLVARQRETGVRPKFVLDPKSPDWDFVRAVGPVVPYTPVRYRLASLFAEWTVSSHFGNHVRRPFLWRQHLVGDLFLDHRFAFLQHGITQNDMSPYLHRASKDFSLLVAASPREREGFLAGGAYGYGPDEVVLAGFPRFDFLENRAEKIVAFMPTWRRGLVKTGDAAHGRNVLREGFRDSPYARSVRETLSDPNLLAAARRLGYRLLFLPHPDLMTNRDAFGISGDVEILGPDASYRDLFARASLCVTDYSSAVFDFAFLRKPVMYCQTDPIHYARGWFDYERDGFGPVFRDRKSLVEAIVSAMERGCPLEEPYRSRVEAFFPFRDRDNCRRVADAILAASRNRSDKVHSSVLFARPVS